VLINKHKTKEMVITLSHTFTIQNLSGIQQIDTFKLLGTSIYVSSDLCLQCFDAIGSAAGRASGL